MELEKLRQCMFLVMVLSYTAAIIYTGIHVHNQTTSISQIISQNKLVLASYMSIMALSNIVYESLRPDSSKYFVFLIWIGIVGVFSYDENSWTHYIFASVALLAILMFMKFHRNTSYIFQFLFSFQTVVVEILILEATKLKQETMMMMKTANDIFVPEVLFLLVFAIYYLLLFFKN